MRITRITTYPVDVPVQEEWKITSSLATHHQTRIVLLKLETDEGISGAREPVRLESGCAYCPDGPGLGIEVDWERVRSLAI